MVRGAGACWHVLKAKEQVCRAHTAREVVAASTHCQEDRQEGQNLWEMRMLREHHAFEAEEEIGEWREGQARRQIE